MFPNLHEMPPWTGAEDEEVWNDLLIKKGG